MNRNKPLFFTCKENRKNPVVFSNNTQSNELQVELKSKIFHLKLTSLLKQTLDKYCSGYKTPSLINYLYEY